MRSRVGAAQRPLQLVTSSWQVDSEVKQRFSRLQQQAPESTRASCKDHLRSLLLCMNIAVDLQQRQCCPSLSDARTCGANVRKSYFTGYFLLHSQGTNVENCIAELDEKAAYLEICCACSHLAVDRFPAVMVVQSLVRSR